MPCRRMRPATPTYFILHIRDDRHATYSTRQAGPHATRGGQGKAGAHAVPIEKPVKRQQLGDATRRVDAQSGNITDTRR